MTQDDIMLMAQKAGPLTQGPFTEWCKRFANLVAAAKAEEFWDRKSKAITAIKEALAQPEQEPVQEPVAYDKTEMNSFVIDLYDEKMKEGKHGHYEAMFHCVHQAIKRAAHGIKEQP
jgi:hypothetical protein